MSNKQIVKTENCPGCLHCAQNYVEDEELVILCDLELEGYEEAEGEKCLHYTIEASKMDDEPVDEGDQDGIVTFGSDHTKSGFGSGGRKIMAAKVKKYIFVGDKLSEVKNPKEGQEVIELNAAFAVAWNLKVDQLKEDYAREIEHLASVQQDQLTEAKGRLVEGDFILVEDLFEDEISDDEAFDDYEDDDLDGDGPEDDDEDEAEDNPDDDARREETVAKKSTVKKPVAKKSAPKKPVTKKRKK